MQKLRFWGEILMFLHALLIICSTAAHIDCINSNITVLNNTAFLILVERTLWQGDILKPLIPLSFYHVSLLSLSCILVNNNSNVLKSLNIGHVITSFQFEISMLNLTRYFHKN